MSNLCSVSQDYQELISVIVPVYNIERFLPRCLECISLQTYNNLEIILVDDGSNDGSGRILDSYAEKEKRARVIHHERNLGLWAARNTGQDAASGAYLWFPDGDDFFHRDFVRILYEAIKSGPGYDVALSGWKATPNRDEDILAILEPHYIHFTRESYLSFIDAKSPDMWNKLYKRSSLGTIHTRPYLRAQGRDFNIRTAFVIHNAIGVQECLYYWYQHSDSLSKSTDANELYLSCMCNMYYDMFLNLPQNLNRFKGFLLSHLFYKMIQWKLLVDGQSNQDEVFSLCREYEQRTRWSYLFNRDINTVEKIICQVLVHNPRLVSRLHYHKTQRPKNWYMSIQSSIANFFLRFAFL